MTGKRVRRAAAALGADLSLSVRPDQPEGEQPIAGAVAGGRPGSSRRAAKRAAAAARPAPAAVAQAAVDSGTQADEQEAAFVVPDDAIVRRTKDGWRVGGDDLPDLTCAMILADIIAAETGMPQSRPSKPGMDSAATSEAGRLRATVGQLEHALQTRIRVEQAIGVLAERHRIKPRQAFEQLRDAARSRGRKVIDIAGDVVASATNPLLQLPDELSRPRSGPRRAARQSFGQS